MKIGIVCYPTYGGSGIIATELGISLAKKGHEIHIISYATPARLRSYVGNIIFHEVEIPHYPLFEFQLYTLALAGKIVDICKRINLDILHVHYAIPHSISGILSRQILEKENKQFKLISTLHGTDITLVGLEAEYKPLVKFAIENSDSVTSVSRYLKDKTIEYFNIDSTNLGKKIEIIPNFVDGDIYRRNENAEIKEKITSGDEFIIMHVSNFRPYKNVGDAIKVLAKVLDEIPAKLVLIGDGPTRSESEKAAWDLNVSDNVLFLGKQSDISNLLSCADVFILPSRLESFGLSALEAMSCGVPVIASDTGGIPEVVIHNENGFLSPVGDIEKMSAYIKKLAKNPKLWESISENCRRRALSEFNPDKIVGLYENLYIKTLNQ